MITATATLGAASSSVTRTKKRFAILAMLFIVTTINYADRATLSIAGPALSKDLGIDSVTMGFIFSAFGWSYVIAQLPGGWLLDRYGSKKVYAASIFIWSVFTLLQGGISFPDRHGHDRGRRAVRAAFSRRRGRGAVFPGQWPHRRVVVPRGGARHGLRHLQLGPVFRHRVVRAADGLDHAQLRLAGRVRRHGLLGIVISAVWMKTVFTPRTHPGVNQAELDYIAAGGALVNMDQPGTQSRSFGADSPKLNYVKQLLSNRMLMGVYIGQYCITTLTYFFLTWFPVYLVKERGMSILNAGFVAALPAICGFAGGVLGGLISDSLLRRGKSLTFARKAPIVVGMLLSTSMILCNYVDSATVVVAIMSLAFFGKGLGALGWAVVSDTSPKEISGLSGAVFNTFGNTAGITTPIVIGYLIKGTGSFNAALIFVAANALVAVCCYLFVVGDIKRFELRKAV